MIKTLMKIVIEIESLPQNNKSHIWQTQNQHYINWGETERICLKPRTRQLCPFSSVLFNTVFKTLATASRQEKERKGKWMGKEEVIPIVDNRIIYTKYPKIPAEDLKLTNKFSRVTGYRINIQKSIMFLYTNNESTKKEIRKTIHS